MERLTWPKTRAEAWAHAVCGVLLLATMLNYMDRQTLSLTIQRVQDRYLLSNEAYGWFEFAFGIAFALGGLTMGVLVDRLSVRLLYPLVLICWSLAGLSTAYAPEIGALVSAALGTPALGAGALGGETGAAGSTAPASANATFVGFLLCRALLGFFEAGQWPCALVTTQRLLARKDRTLGNSLLQSGASLGAVLTPSVVWLTATQDAEGWRAPYVVIGLAGLLWAPAWLALVRGGDLRRRDAEPSPGAKPLSEADANGKSIEPRDPRTPGEVAASVNLDLEPVDAGDKPSQGDLVGRGADASGVDGSGVGGWLRKFLVLVVVVIAINLTWQYFRAWMPKLLKAQHGYSDETIYVFTMVYYVVTDVGCVVVGLTVSWLTYRGWSAHAARAATFTLCALLTALSMLAAAEPAGPVLLALLLLIAFGSLGLFPNYYSYTQEISRRHQGKVTGTLGAITWTCSSVMQVLVGKQIDDTKSYAEGLFVMGLPPLVAAAALWLFWPRDERDAGVGDH